jgi:PAS domain S-box-containing protein
MRMTSVFRVSSTQVKRLRGRQRSEERAEVRHVQMWLRFMYFASNTSNRNGLCEENRTVRHEERLNTTIGSVERTVLGPVVLRHPVATVVYDAEFRIVDVNDAYTKLFGLSREQVVGLPGLDLVHPDDRENLRGSMGAVLADARRTWPGNYFRVPSALGGWASVAANISVVDPPVDAIHFVAGIVEASFHVAMDKLMDVLTAGQGIAAVLGCVIDASESTGHYKASLHHRAGFTTGAFTHVVAGSVRELVDLRSSALESVVANACRTGETVYARLGELGIEEPLVSGHLQLRQFVAFPFVVKGEPAGALCIWTEQEERLGHYGAAHIERVARLTGQAVRNQIDFDAARPSRVVGGLQIDLVGRTAEVDGRTVRLTPIEVTILDLLSEVPGRTVTRERIITQLFGSTHTGGSRTCDAHIRNLRAKLRDDPALPRFIATIRGEGYALVLSYSATR